MDNRRRRGLLPVFAAGLLPSNNERPNRNERRFRMRPSVAGLWRCGEAASHEPSLSAAATAPSETELRMADDAVVAQKGPYQVELTEGKPYLYCRCGRSQKQPFCDGSHTGTGLEPLRFVVDHTGTFNICGCKGTDDEPFCDGSHLML
jgi:CDGSH-type Zn-finger protein